MGKMGGEILEWSERCLSGFSYLSIPLHSEESKKWRERNTGGGRSGFSVFPTISNRNDIKEAAPSSLRLKPITPKCSTYNAISFMVGINDTNLLFCQRRVRTQPSTITSMQSSFPNLGNLQGQHIWSVMDKLHLGETTCDHGTSLAI